MNRLIMSAPPFSSVAREPAGGASPGRYLPVSTPCAIGRPDDLPDPQLAAGRHDLGLDDAPEHGVLRLLRHEVHAELLGQCVAGADLRRASTR